MSFISSLYNLALLGRIKDDPGAFDASKVERILVVRNDNIGDVICTTPALDALRQAFPRAFIAALVCTLTEEAISGHRALDAVYAYPKVKHRHFGKLESLRRHGAVMAEIRRQGFDLALALRVEFSTSQAWLAYASRARWRAGPQARGSKSRWGFFYNLPLEPPPRELHEVERCFHLLRQIQVDSSSKRLYLKVPPQAGEVAQNFLAQSGIDGDEGPVIVNATRWAYRPDRTWPADKYRDLVAALTRRGIPVAVTHAPQDRPWVADLLQGLSPMPPVFWSSSLKEFCALAARARVFITAEGGPMHLAAAVGTPVLVLWGDTPLEVWRPWGVPHQVLEDHRGVGEISVEQVMEALGRI
ncbi:MAG: glycosyltransferase family 9 protein [Desulfarculaceae bacterium]|jgi:ADP-heptose:LPS heptosyltransferase